MKPRSLQTGFTLVELLVSIGIIALAAALALPSLSRSMRNAKRVQCLNNQRQIGIAFQQFADLNHNKYPMQLAAFRSKIDDAPKQVGFLVLSESPFIDVAPELASPKLLTCAADRDTEAAETFGDLSTGQISYVVATNARPGDARTVVATDHNVAFAEPEVVQESGPWIRFENTIHELRGNVLMGDGRVEWVRGFTWRTGEDGVSPRPDPTNAPPLVAPAIAVQPTEQSSPSRPSPQVTFRSEPRQSGALPEVQAGQTGVEPNTDVPAGATPPNSVGGPVAVSLLPTDGILPSKRTQWWWLILLLLLAFAGWAWRRKSDREPPLKNRTEFYTGAAINAEAMLATLDENDIPVRREFVYSKLRENESETTRPIRLFVERDRLAEANALFSAGSTE